MGFWILDDTLFVNIAYEKQGVDLRDNIRIFIKESCPEDEKLFLADETNIYLTTDEARQIMEALRIAILNSQAAGDQDITGNTSPDPLL
jgi:hypothetical protein